MRVHSRSDGTVANRLTTVIVMSWVMVIFSKKTHHTKAFVYIHEGKTIIFGAMAACLIDFSMMGGINRVDKYKLYA